MVMKRTATVKRQPARRPERHEIGELLIQLLAADIPMPVCAASGKELWFAWETMRRKWRFDMAWPDVWLAVEVDGATWAQGRHTRGGGHESDCEKLNAATLLGWRVLRFTYDMVSDGRALAMIEQALRATHTERPALPLTVTSRSASATIGNRSR